MKKKSTAPAEKFWQALVDVYFQFYKTHFRDQDGYQLTPDWSATKVGMESKGLKEIIIRLRIISEEKNIEWTEEYALSQMNLFLKKAYRIPFLKKSFMCCLLNKYKDQVITSKDNPVLVEKILEVWYFEFNQYTRDLNSDREAVERIIEFLKNQYEISKLVFTDESVIGTIRTLINHIKPDDFWNTKSLRSISYNLQELINKIKSKNGNNNSKRITSVHRVEPKPKGGFGKL